MATDSDPGDIVEQPQNISRHEEEIAELKVKLAELGEMRNERDKLAEEKNQLEIDLREREMEIVGLKKQHDNELSRLKQAINENSIARDAELKKFKATFQQSFEMKIQSLRGREKERIAHLQLDLDDLKASNAHLNEQLRRKDKELRALNEILAHARERARDRDDLHRENANLNLRIGHLKEQIAKCNAVCEKLKEDNLMLGQFLGDGRQQQSASQLEPNNYTDEQLGLHLVAEEAQLNRAHTAQPDYSSTKAKPDEPATVPTTAEPVFPEDDQPADWARQHLCVCGRAFRTDDKLVAHMAGCEQLLFD